MTLRLITPPAFEPVTLAEAKAHCRIVINDDDSLVANLISVARERAEHETGRSLMLQAWEQVQDELAGDVRLGMPPVIDVDLFSYVDPDGVLRTLPPDQWTFVS